METLAIFGGAKVQNRPFPFPPFPIVGKAEELAIIRALRNGVLSGFIGAPGDAFLGGDLVKKFESEFASFHGVKHAVAVNSATAALHCALVAAGVGFGDEVIVTPWSFSSSAVTPLMVNAVPVFADIEDRSFGLDPNSVESRISPYTKAIIVVDLFGQPAEVFKLKIIARKHRLVLIEDAAQSPLAMFKNRLAGTIGDIGVFSFTASKQMTTGEGGMVITNNGTYAERVQMVRNHGEVLGTVKDRKTMTGILGWNYRPTEIDAALGLVQFKKLPSFIQKRRRNAAFLNEALKMYPFLAPPYPEKNRTHSYFIYALKYDEKKAFGVHRNVFVKALEAEGIPVGSGYVPPLYWNPVYQWKEFYGEKQFPFAVHPRPIDYPKGLCPVAERLHSDVVINTFWTHPKLTLRDVQSILRAIDKVVRYLPSLRGKQL